MQERKSYRVMYVVALAAVLAGASIFGAGSFANAQSNNATDHSHTNSTNTNGNAASSGPSNNSNSPAANSMNNNMMNNGMMNNAMLNGSLMLKGQISNVQTNSSGMPTYIESGVFVVRVIPQSNGTSHAQLYARFDMIKPDGTGPHTHMIYRFQMTNMTTAQNDTVVVATGTATVTLAGSPVKDVPITIKVFNHKVVGFWIGPDKINGHFGTNALYGILSKPSRSVLGEMRSMMH